MIPARGGSIPNTRTGGASGGDGGLSLALESRRNRRSLSVGHGELFRVEFTCTRESGPLIRALSVWRADDAHGRPLSAVVQLQAHPTVMMQLGLTDVSP